MDPRRLVGALVSVLVGGMGRRCRAKRLRVHWGFLPGSVLQELGGCCVFAVCVVPHYLEGANGRSYEPLTLVEANLIVRPPILDRLLCDGRYRQTPVIFNGNLCVYVLLKGSERFSYQLSCQVEGRLIECWISFSSLLYNKWKLEIGTLAGFGRTLSSRLALSPELTRSRRSLFNYREPSSRQRRTRARSSRFPSLLLERSFANTLHARHPFLKLLPVLRVLLLFFIGLVEVRRRKGGREFQAIAVAWCWRGRGRLLHS